MFHQNAIFLQHCHFYVIHRLFSMFIRLLEFWLCFIFVTIRNFPEVIMVIFSSCDTTVAFDGIVKELCHAVSLAEAERKKSRTPDSRFF